MLNDADYQKLSEQLPVVLFDRHMNDSSLPLVLTDSITPTATLVADIARQHPDECPGVRKARQTFRSRSSDGNYHE